MKVYLYHEITGVYEGETFEEADMLQHEDALITNTPPDCQSGQVSVFDRQQNAWTVIPVTFVKQLLSLGAEANTESKL